MKRKIIALLLAAMMALATAAPAAMADVPNSKLQKDLAQCAAADYDPFAPACWAMSWDTIQDWTNPPQAGG